MPSSFPVHPFILQCWGQIQDNSSAKQVFYQCSWLSWPCISSLPASPFSHPTPSLQSLLSFLLSYALLQETHSPGCAGVSRSNPETWLTEVLMTIRTTEVRVPTDGHVLSAAHFIHFIFTAPLVMVQTLSFPR